MVCEHCGAFLRESDVVCPECGADVITRAPVNRASGRRQGKPEYTTGNREASISRWPDMPPSPQPIPLSGPPRRRLDAGRPDEQRGLPPKPTTGQKLNHSAESKPRPVKHSRFNWWMFAAVMLLLVIMGIIGGLLFLNNTDSGQLILARMGRETDALSQWTYGQELFDQGYVERAIESFETAYALEPEREDIYNRLLVLADAYEAAGRTTAAEELFRKLCEIEPTNVTAYRNIIRLMENQNRRMELVTFLKTAYEATKDTSFRTQRTELLPSTPTTSEEAGKLRRERDVALLSAEDYDIYYTMNETDILPEDGILYTTPIHLGKGTHLIRAVAVSSDLISDELNVKFTIELPVPRAPLSSLAPGEYSKRYKITLSYKEKEEDKADTVEDPKEDDITIYYTIDGQTPTSNSPIFTGEEFQLPAGKSTLKAVAVNGYGEVSNVLERTYKVNVKYERYFNENDEFSGFTMLKTSRDDFVKKYGNPQAEKEIEDSTMLGLCTQLRYSWGEARFLMTKDGYKLYYVETNSASMIAPRKTKVGMMENEVIALFRDMEQTYNQNGDRSVYWDENEGYAMVYHLGNDAERLDYVYYLQDTTRMILSYHLQNDRVVKITMRNSYSK